MASEKSLKLERVGEFEWRIPPEGGMRVEGRFFASEKMHERILADNALTQVCNVAFLPGIQMASLAMPDIHWGYGFPIGGVAATSVRDGVISPGGVGYDIACGVRLLRTDLTLKDVAPQMDRLLSGLFTNVPSGVGRGGIIRADDREMTRVLSEGTGWAVKQGYGVPEDLERTEDNGCLKPADADVISKEARKRGRDQLGTLGAGNHFLEVQIVDEIYDPSAAEALGFEQGQITVMIHCGSRGLGHQVCTDYVNFMRHARNKFKFDLPDQELVCAPVSSDEGQQYLHAMNAAANYALANRQCIMHWVRETFEQVFGRGWQKLGMTLVYDVSHNIAKIERHQVGSVEKELCVHRKGATRSFPAGHPSVTPCYRSLGQPVIVPGNMGDASYVLLGTRDAMQKSFGSTCHGAGRQMSRHQAIKAGRGRSIERELGEKGIQVRAHGRDTLAEEMPEAYKNIDEVVAAVEGAGLSSKVVRLRPLGVIKG